MNPPAALATGSPLTDEAMPMPPHGKLTALSLGESAPRPILEKLEEIARLPYVDGVLALPDLHWKARMEVPSSIAIATRGVVVPEFTSAAINDGMGVLRTGLTADEMTPERLELGWAAVGQIAAGSGWVQGERYGRRKSRLASSSPIT